MGLLVVVIYVSLELIELLTLSPSCACRTLFLLFSC